MLFIGAIGMGSSVLVKKIGNLFLPWYLMTRTKS
jgi:NitT/TauT family transport system permease protein